MKAESPLIPTVIAVLTALVLVPQAQAMVIFSHDFSVGAANLNGTPVDVGTGNWVAATVFSQNGNFGGNPGSATLAFTPQNGNLYSLDATLTGITGNGNWVAMGFANGQNPDANTANRFINVNVLGTAWMFARGDNSANPNEALLGLGAGTNGGVTSPQNFDGPLANANGGDLDLRILLDTRGGAGTWTATWLAKRPTDADYTVVRPTAPTLTESMNSVGFALSNAGVSGTIESFSLSIVPEPSMGLLLALGGLGFLGRRRR